MAPHLSQLDCMQSVFFSDKTGPLKLHAFQLFLSQPALQDKVALLDGQDLTETLHWSLK